MEKAAGWTMGVSNGFGGVSKMNGSTCRPWRMGLRLVLTLVHGSAMPTTHGLIRLSMAKHRMRGILSRIFGGLTLKRRNKRHNINPLIVA